jgi:hypothetical protein
MEGYEDAQPEIYWDLRGLRSSVRRRIARCGETRRTRDQLNTMTLPYLLSLQPIYCKVTNHSLALCDTLS